MKTLKKQTLRQIRGYASQAKIWHSDVQGSYTGAPLYDHTPVQDADDL